MKASRAAQLLNEIVETHGDVEILVYDNSDDNSYSDVEIEYNDDIPDQPVVLIGIDSHEEKGKTRE